MTTLPASTPPAPSWGIDTVRISYRLILDNCDPYSPIWHSSRSTNLTNLTPEIPTLVGTHVVGNVPVSVRLYPTWQVVHLEFNASAFTKRHPYELCPPEALATIAHRIIADLQHVAWPAFVHADPDSGELLWEPHWQSMVRFKRLDIARNLLVPDAQHIRLALRDVKPKYYKDGMERHSRTGYTLYNKSKSNGLDRLYDKSGEMPLPNAGRGRVLRFEAQLEGARLQKFGLAELSGVSAEACWRALEHRWDACRWGTPIGHAGGAVRATDRLSVPQQDRLLGFLHKAAAGQMERYTDAQIRGYAKQARLCGLEPGVPVSLLGEAHTFLDLHAGMHRTVPSRIPGTGHSPRFTGLYQFLGAPSKCTSTGL